MSPIPYLDSRRAAGALVTLLMVFSLAHAFRPAVPALAAGASAWLAVLLLWPGLRRVQRVQVLLMLAVGGAGMGWGAYAGGAAPLGGALTRNDALLSMIAAVTFLRLVSLPAESSEELPRGRRAFLRTLVGVHLFGASINVSGVMIIGDRLVRHAPLDRNTAVLLSRGFSAAALWSPFFAGTATALTYAPGARWPVLLSLGIPLAASGLLYTYGEVLRADPRRLAGFHGYPMRADGLRVPLTLAGGVLVCHLIVPQVSVLTVITLMAPLVTLAILLLRHGPGGTVPALGEHALQRLPEMGGELALFLAAGVLAGGLDAVFSTFPGWIPFQRLDANTASVSLVLMVGLAVLGVHPVISISALAVLLAPIHPDPSLAAATYVMSWAIGVATSPLSATHLVMKGRYGIEAWRICRWNVRYTLVMLVLAVLALHLYAWIA